MSRSIAIREPLELLTEIANSIALNGDSGVVWLCEGPDDKTAIEHHDPNAIAFVAGNKGAVLKCASVLANLELSAPRWVRTRSAAWFLVDRDYDDSQSNNARILRTHWCSLEADLLDASGAESVRVLAPGTRTKEAQEIIDTALAVAGDLGCVRMHSASSGLALRLREFPVARVLNDDCIDWEQVRTVIGERHPEMLTEAQAAIEQGKKISTETTDNALARTNGHDLVGAIQTIVNARTRQSRGFSTRDVFRALVYAADPAKLRWMATQNSESAAKQDPEAL